MERGVLEVRLLGHIEVLIDDRPVAVTANRQRVVLAMLALSAGELVTVERLTDALWDEQLPGDTRASLHIHVARLRSVLGAGWIATGPGGYRLECHRHQVDALRFRDLVEKAQLDTALALWRDTPFTGIESRLLAETEAPRLVETYVSATERRIDLEISAGRYADLTAELHDLVGRYPLVESLWARLIVVLGRAGRQAEALACYERIRARLADELGVSPGEELQRLHTELLVEHPRAQRAPNQLPPDIGHFVGRADACSALDALVADWDTGRAALAILHGAGGVGKTSLATHWAHGLRDRFSGGLLFLDLHGYGPGRPMEPAVALDNLLRALGIPGRTIPAGIDARCALLRTTLAERRALMFLDNARDSEQVRPLLPGSSTFVLVTSRNRLRGLAAREGARDLPVGRLSPPESRQLLTAALRGRQISYAEELMTGLAQLCDHLPLALVIAAERAGRPMGSIDELIDELKELRLDALDLADDPLSSVRGVLASSYQVLSPGTARLFRLLGPQPDQISALRPSRPLRASAHRRVAGCWTSCATRTCSARPRPSAFGCTTWCGSTPWSWWRATNERWRSAAWRAGRCIPLSMPG